MKFLKKSLCILLSVAMTASIATAAASADGEGARIRNRYDSKLVCGKPQRP